MTDEELARAILVDLGTVNDRVFNTLISSFMKAGEWAQVGTQALSRAWKDNISIDPTLSREAIRQWGLEEMGSLIMSRYSSVLV